jgi:hypothetical protein
LVEIVYVAYCGNGLVAEAKFLVVHAVVPVGDEVTAAWSEDHPDLRRTFGIVVSRLDRNPGEGNTRVLPLEFGYSAVELGLIANDFRKTGTYFSPRFSQITNPWG